MEQLEPYQLWMLMAAVAYVAYLFGRASARGEGSGEGREERRMREDHEAERAFSSLPPSKQADVDRLLSEKKLIAAIKVIREETGIGLRDAKLAAERRQRALKGSPL